MKNLAIVGSTGSIGTTTLRIAAHLKEQMRVVALAARSNIDLLEAQAKQFQPKMVAVLDVAKALELQRRLPGIRVLAGMDGVCEAVGDSSVNFVVSAFTGSAGLRPTLAALRAGKDVGLANKEALVCGGALVVEARQQGGGRLLPIDSEHSALFQCLEGEQPTAVNRLILTASGGPFRTYSLQQLEQVTVREALKHPNWKMGAKVTIDCSTLMNKGLEAIEAHWLFGFPVERIEAVIHPQSIIHSMVEFVDGSIKAQMGDQDMALPIQHAITYPERRPSLVKPMNFNLAHALHFEPIDLQKFVCFRLAFDALKTGGTLPAYMNAANEQLVQRFAEGQITWLEIGRKLEYLMARHRVQPKPSFEEIEAVDAEARREAAEASL